MNKSLSIWTVYKHPQDFPNQFVARRFGVLKGTPIATTDYFADTDVEKVRDWIKQEATKFPQGMPHRLPRDPMDDPRIYENWV